MPKTYNEVFVSVRNALRDMNTTQSSLEARLLLSSASGKNKEELTRDMPLFVGSSTQYKAEYLLRRRKKGEPLAYITGEWEFYGMPIKVNRHVLIPRVDTEVTADAAIREALQLDSGARALDLCCGSGCIGIALASNVPELKVTMADISKEAIKVAKSNVSMNNLSGRVACVEADVLDVPRSFLGSFELVVSNPPYIPSGDLEELDKSVIGYEPITALDGGSDGMEFYRSIALMWKKVLKPGGCLVLECGVRQSKLVEYLLRVNGFENIEIVADSGGIERVAMGWLPLK